VRPVTPPARSLVIATHNLGKLDEFRVLLGPLGYQLSSALDHNCPEPDETETTFVGNAALKARQVCAATGLPALGDDSGLAVEALGGAPGIYSARWAQTAHGRDFDFAMARLLRELAGHNDRRARFVCALALVTPDGKEHNFVGELHGMIAPAPKGDNGFGYDPIFVPDSYAQTMAEMSTEHKNRISHRALACQALLEFLQQGGVAKPSHSYAL
jgi:XTP/dITP diphosphohydrolase